MKTCNECGKATTKPERIPGLELIPYKRNGWTGGGWRGRTAEDGQEIGGYDGFVPYDKKYKGVKEKTTLLCGPCAALHYLEEQRQTEAITEMEYEALRQELVALATKEVAAGVISTNGHKNGAAPHKNNLPPRTKIVKIKRSPEEARFFGRYSVANAVLVESTFNCGCKAYEDTFTFGRWLAQGMAVQRGQHGVKLPILYHQDRKDPDTGEIEAVVQRRGMAVVFCRHQVGPAKVQA